MVAVSTAGVFRTPTAGRAGRRPTPVCPRSSCRIRTRVRAVRAQDRQRLGLTPTGCICRTTGGVPQRRRGRALDGHRRGPADHVRFRGGRASPPGRHGVPLPDQRRRRPRPRRTPLRRVFPHGGRGPHLGAAVEGAPEGDHYGTVLRDALCTDDRDPAGVYSATATVSCSPRPTTATAAAAGRASAGRACVRRRWSADSARGASALGRRGEGRRLIADGCTAVGVTPVAPRPLHEIVEPGWAKALEPVAGRIAEMGDFLRAEIAAGRTYLPAGPNVLRAFQQPSRRGTGPDRRSGPVSDPGARGGPVVLRSARGASAPPSLINIFRELNADLGLPQPSTGDLTPWTQQGVLLLNRALHHRAAQSGRAPPRAGRRSPSRRSGRWRRAANRWCPSRGAVTPAICVPCWAVCRRWSPRILTDVRRPPSSARARSAGPTTC